MAENKYSTTLPPIPEDLLKALEEKYPEKYPDVIHTPEKLLSFKQGEISVIRMLRSRFELQKEMDALIVRVEGIE